MGQIARKEDRDLLADLGVGIARMAQRHQLAVGRAHIEEEALAEFFHHLDIAGDLGFAAADRQMLGAHADRHLVAGLGA